MKSRLLLLLCAAPFLNAQTTGGFVESRLGGRTQSDPGQDSASIREIRAQFSHSQFLGPFDTSLKADAVYDDLARDRGSIDLDSGDGWLDLRTAWIAARPSDNIDLKIGRQVLTWGTGDLLFLNDLFPKDWHSFFNGRDVEYLKAPSDAVWSALYLGDWTFDAVWTPRFDADRYLDGDGISFYPGMFSPANPLPADEPDDGEWSFRLARPFGSLETALYAYQGFWKSPGGFSPQGIALFPELRVWGASALFPAAGGLANLEAAYYDSLEDRDGRDPSLNNSEARFLAGFNRELAADLTLGLQAYLEWMQDHNDYRSSLPAGQPARDELREVTTLRLTRMMMNQNLILSGFLFLSPTDEDLYLRASVEYKWSDTLSTTLGANLFAGQENHTFFGQFEDNSNVYVAVRRWF